MNPNSKATTNGHFMHLLRFHVFNLNTTYYTLSFVKNKKGFVDKTLRSIYYEYM